MLGKARGGLMVSCALALAGCGGGGGSETSTAQPLSALQQTVQDTYSTANGGSYSLSMFLPTSGSTNSFNYAFATRYGVSTTLSTTPQNYDETLTPISAVMGMPTFSNWFPSRALIGGSFVLAPVAPSLVERIRLTGDTVVSEIMAGDNVTVHSAVRFTSLQGFPLSGAFVTAPSEVRIWPALAPLSSNSALLKPNPAFIAGSTYFKRKVVRQGDVVFISDCGAPTTNVNPLPCAVSNTIESLLPYVYGGTTYNLADGSIQTLQGLRAWISNAPLPTATSATAASLVLVERGGNVYRGILQRDGTPIMTNLGNGSTVDFTLRFNQQAIDSLKAAVAF